MASIAYNRFKAEVMKGNVSLGTDTLRVLLVDDTYTPNADHNVVSDVTAAELSGTGYNRQTLVNPNVVEDDLNDRAYFDADDNTWTGINAGRMSYAVIYKQTGGDDTTPADDILLFCIDIADVITNGGDVAISWNDQGIIELS